MLASCNSILKSRPAGTLSEEQMVNILVDIHLTEATLRLGNDSIARLNDTADLRMRFARVFRKQDVSPDEFNTSLNYYLEHIELLDKIYTEVINRLSVMEADLLKVNKAVDFTKTGWAKTAPRPDQLRNKWFMTLYKPDKPQPVQYFSPVIYPVE